MSYSQSSSLNNEFTVLVKYLNTNRSIAFAFLFLIDTGDNFLQIIVVVLNNSVTLQQA